MSNPRSLLSFMLLAVPLPEKTFPADHAVPNDPAEFGAWQAETRRWLGEMLGLPRTRVPLDTERRGQFEWDEEEPHAGQRPMPLDLHPDMVSRKALAAGFGGTNGHAFTGG
jgi:hypothetical protein